jgi:dCMP deaminase
MTVIAYFPAYHRGYAEFLGAHEGPVYVLDTQLVRQLYPKAERDVRAIQAIDMVAVLRSTWNDVHILDEEALPKLGTAPIVMPDEDISRLFAQKYLKDKKVTFVPAHLRWDGQWASKESPVPPDRIVSTDALDREFIAKATKAAVKSPDWWRQVGAVIAKDGKALITGYNRPNHSDTYDLNAMGDPRSNFDAGVSYDLTTAEHGEAYAIGLAARDGTALKGAAIYVTTFPCPTCAKLIATAGIAKVFYAEGYSLIDAEATLRDAGIEIIQVKR